LKLCDQLTTIISTAQHLGQLVTGEELTWKLMRYMHNFFLSEHKVTHFERSFKMI